MSFAAMLKLLLANLELFELLAEALRDGKLTRDEAIGAIKAAMTAASDEQMKRELGP